MKWEYRIEDSIGDIGMDDLGFDGWELVAVTRTDSGVHSFYFKRLVEPSPESEVS